MIFLLPPGIKGLKLLNFQQKSYLIAFNPIKPGGKGSFLPTANLNLFLSDLWYEPETLTFPNFY